MDEMLEQLERALINTGAFDNVEISEDRKSVFYTDDAGNNWAITPEQF